MRKTEPDPQLEQEARQALAFLFTDHNARITISQRLPGLGNGQVFIQVRGLTLRVVQTEGNIKVLVAPRHAPREWHRIEFILPAVDPSGKFPPPPVYGSLPDLSPMLAPLISSISDALSAERFASTIQRAREVAKKRFVGAISAPGQQGAPARTSLGKRILIAPLYGIFRVIRFLTSKPKDDYAKFLPVASDSELEGTVQREFSLLFERHGARISSSGRLPIMDFAWVALDVGNLRVLAARDRGSVGISIAPLCSIRNSCNLTQALLAVRENADETTEVPTSILYGAGSRTDAAFSKLNEAFSETNFPATRQRIHEISETHWKNFVDEWNSKVRARHATR